MRSRGLTAGAAVIALVLQCAPIYLLAANWSSDRDMTQGWCGYDGTCSDDTNMAWVAVGLVLVPLVEVALGLTWQRLIRAAAIRPALVRATTGILAGTGVTVLLVVQDGVLQALGGPWGHSDATKAQFILHGTALATAAELAVAVTATLVLRYRRAAVQAGA